MRRTTLLLMTVGVALALSIAGTISATTTSGSPASEMDASAQLRQAVSVEGIMAHEQNLQNIADANGGTRASGTPGYDASADYVADQLRAAGYDVTIQPFTFQISGGRTRTTSNVIAETSTGNAAHTIVVGAHLDSVRKGPGINDNGSGVSTALETALQMSKLGIQPGNKVRFAFFGAEEYKRAGSKHYVNNLSQQERDAIELYLNFDMIASLNYVRYVFDGDNLSYPGPAGSAEIEKVFTDYYAAQALPTKPRKMNATGNAFDLITFINAGIPAGGLHTGSKGLKTEKEAAVYGGTAGLAYDPCYHQPCDTPNNVSTQALDEMSDGVAHATLTLANRVYN